MKYLAQAMWPIF